MVLKSLLGSSTVVPVRDAFKTNSSHLHLIKPDSALSLKERSSLTRGLSNSLLTYLWFAFAHGACLVLSDDVNQYSTTYETFPYSHPTDVDAVQD